MAATDQHSTPTNPGPFVVHTGFGFMSHDGTVVDQPHHKAQRFDTVDEATAAAQAVVGVTRSTRTGRHTVTGCRVFQAGRFTEQGTVAVVR